MSSIASNVTFGDENTFENLLNQVASKVEIDGLLTVRQGGAITGYQ